MLLSTMSAFPRLRFGTPIAMVAAALVLKLQQGSFRYSSRQERVGIILDEGSIFES
jgi:hypothetical protein